jgi:hypothetical protein
MHHYLYVLSQPLCLYCETPHFSSKKILINSLTYINRGVATMLSPPIQVLQHLFKAQSLKAQQELSTAKIIRQIV